MIAVTSKKLDSAALEPPPQRTWKAAACCPIPPISRHAALDACLGDKGRLPLARVRRFFEMTQQHDRKEGDMGCLLGGLGQELSGVSEVFRRKIEGCFSEIAERMAACLEEARQRGDIPADADARHMASLLVNCWEGAALRSRLQRDAAPLNAMLDFYDAAITLLKGRREIAGRKAGA
jgi:TetR/AcrR family transcriptional repressor of nem operon